ncbi:type III-B CRISPR module RAMP protein Cmr4 [Clostridium sediminicola]|uniref:type III-B CRISPR module RAMP protein Cmr4 n=1 Tax=Clostridium sediminicola TaxID=3114879 RepID=UPI0031F276BE
MKSSFYIITALTNMHVGSGENNFNIIDNEVQKDVLTGYPVINSSSLKGSLREYCKNKLNEDYIFGSHKSIGMYKFFSGKLLCIPVRSTYRTFYRATCFGILEELLETIKDFNINNCDKLKKEIHALIKLHVNKNSALILKADNKNEEKISRIEDLSAQENDELRINIGEITKVFGEDLVLLNDGDFNAIVKNLPVVARNCLDNGESKNLWYEEIVPRESRFYFQVIKGEKDDGQFDKVLQENIVQIGGNSTIGYGYTKILKLK